MVTDRLPKGYFFVSQQGQTIGGNNRAKQRTKKKQNMIRATIHLPHYGWTIYAYIAVNQYYTYEIIDKMRKIGADRDMLASAHRNLMSGNLNNGLTMSNPITHETVWVVALTSSAAEFFNTIVHEIRHLEQHIANECGLDQNSEEVCYLCGDIAFRLFPYCKKLLCEHCRKHN